MSHKIHSHPGMSVRFGLPDGHTIIDSEHFALALKHWDLILEAEKDSEFCPPGPLTAGSYDGQKVGS